MTDEFTFVTDLAPTVLDLVGIEDHRGSWNGESVEPIVGSSLADHLTGTADRIHPPSEPIGYELGGSSVLFKGDYKIVINRFERNETDWRMYDIKTDPGEVHDLKDARPRLFEEMLADYEAWEEANNVLPMPEGYDRGRAIFGGSLPGNRLFSQ